MKKYFISWCKCFFIILPLFLSSCHVPENKENNDSSIVSNSNEDIGNESVGNFRYIKLSDTVMSNEASSYTDSILEDVVNHLNDRLTLFNDISVFRKDCGFSNAYYKSSEHSIILCNELYDDTTTYSDLYWEIEQPYKMGASIFSLFIFLHEVGHALIDEYMLPVLGKEEDAADAMATVLFIEESTKSDPTDREGAALIIVFSADFLKEYSIGTPFYDTHSMSDVRFANLLCWAVGSTPSIVTNYTYIANLYADTFPNGNRRCSDEYQQQKESVYNLLDPYLKGS